MIGQGFRKNISREEAVFEQLFRSQFRVLYVHAFSMVKDEATAKEIVQQVFFKLWRRKELLDKPVPLNAYLYKAVSNESINYIRQQKTRMAHREAKQRLMPDAIASGENSGMKDLEKRIAAVMEELPEKCRLVFQLSRYEDLRYNEIAHKLGISVKAVEKHITKALRIFREKLKDYLPLFFLLWIHSKF